MLGVWVENEGHARALLPGIGGVLYGKGVKSKPSGNEVHYTSSSILLVKNMPCSKLRCQKFSI